MVLRTIAGISIQAEVVISPATSTRPVVVAASQATRAIGSWARIASRTPSEIWSHSLSGCPSVTDSAVKNDFGFFIKSLIMGSDLLSILNQPLRARLPRVQVFILLRSQRIEAHAHSMELEARNLFVDRGGDGIDTGLQILGRDQHIFGTQILVSKAHIHHAGRMASGGREFYQAAFGQQLH